MNYIFRCSQESNLDHKPFPIEIGHLMHLLKMIFFVRNLLLSPFSILALPELQVHVVLSGDIEKVKPGSH